MNIEMLLGGNPKRKIIIIAIIIVIPILLWLFENPKDIQNKLACGQFSGSEKEECLEYSRCDAIADSRKKGECQCETYRTVGDSEKKESCYVNLAEKFAEPTYCRDKVTNDGNDTSDKDYCYERVARAGQNSSICEIILGSSYKNECYAETASYKNPTVCEKIIDPHYKNECYLKMTFSLTLCEKADASNDVDMCYEKSLNTTICGKFLPVNGRYEHRDTCYGKMAKQTQNEALCEKIIYAYGRESCRLDFHMGESVSYCDTINDSQAAWICYSAYARKTGDHKACEKITFGTNRIDECYLQASEHEKYLNNTIERINICKLIKDSKLKNRCGL